MSIIMRHLMLLLILVIGLFSVSAEDTEYYFKISSPIDLKMPCTVSGNNCNSSSSCNITINYPNQSNMVANAVMTYNPTYFNYTIQNTDTLGEYTGTITCHSGGAYGTDDFKFNINQLGVNNSNLVYISAILIGLFFVFSIIMTIFLYNNNSPLMYMFFILDFLFPTLLTWFIYLLNTKVVDGVSDLIFVLAFVFSILTFISIILVLMELSMYIINRIAQKKTDEWRVI